MPPLPVEQIASDDRPHAARPGGGQPTRSTRSATRRLRTASPPSASIRGGCRGRVAHAWTAPRPCARWCRSRTGSTAPRRSASRARGDRRRRRRDRRGDGLGRAPRRRRCGGRGRPGGGGRSRPPERPDVVVKVIVESAAADRRASSLRACAGGGRVSGADFAKTVNRAGRRLPPSRRLPPCGGRCPTRVAIKASGGIRTAAAARAMLEAGAARIGTSSALAIVGELEAHAVA